MHISVMKSLIQSKVIPMYSIEGNWYLNVNLIYSCAINSVDYIDIGYEMYNTGILLSKSG